MAKDLALKQICPHFITGEWAAIDRRSRQVIRPVMPVTATTQVGVTVNGQDVPSSGLFSGITITALQKPPFHIIQGVNDVFKIRGHAPVTLPPGHHVTARSVVQALQQGFPHLRVDAPGHIQITAVSPEEEEIFLDGGTAHETLGFPLYRQYVSRVVVPGWTLQKPPNHPDPEERYIVFKEPLKSQDDIIELSYFTKRENCRRCQGLVTEHDFRYDSKGDPIFTGGLPLLVQEVEKLVFTIKGSNIFYTWYGTSISDLIGSKIVRGGRFIETQLASEISGALATYKNIKEQQARYQPVSEQEALLRVQNIEVQQDQFDPTYFRVTIALQNRASELDVITKTIVLGQGQ